MNVLIVKYGERIGKMYDYPCRMSMNEEVCLGGERYQVDAVKHFFDAEGIVEYKKFKTPFTRYTLKPIR